MTYTDCGLTVRTLWEYKIDMDTILYTHRKILRRIQAKLLREATSEKEESVEGISLSVLTNANSE